ncbi:LamG-like jellyroll fold domain-containing protein [Kitasatospora sp. NPDC048545]|uniref:LamG-like jellyroll fold domain-containing protein n=1 Tax=Kitasatospora sp. NPDC048545 TaxID=3157208 RepID=UPI0033E92715
MTPPTASSTLSAYDTAVLADAPALYLPLPGPQEPGQQATYHGAPGAALLPNGDSATVFDGLTQYVEIPDSPELSAATTGQLTVEAWLRPDTLTFPRTEGTGYVHWLGKLTYGVGCEWTARMYSQPNTENRANRLSGYAFNPAGGLGAGSYVQEPVTPGAWLHYVLVINTTTRSAAYPSGYVKLYKDGELRDQDSLADYNIVPARTQAPLRVGSASLRSFFAGAVGKVAVYPAELTAAQIAAHHRAMAS